MDLKLSVKKDKKLKKSKKKDTDDAKKSKSCHQKRKKTKKNKRRYSSTSDTYDSNSNDEKKTKPKKKKQRRHESSESSDDTSDESSDLKKKSKLKHKKHRRKYTSSESSNETSDEKSEDSSSRRKSKSKHKKKHRRKHKSSDSSNESDDEIAKIPKINSEKETNSLLQRENWMTCPIKIKTFSLERNDKKVDEKAKIESYDPKLSSRELNPYWKQTGTGLPAFKKPNILDEEDDITHKSRKTANSHQSERFVSNNWRKKVNNPTEEKSYHETTSVVPSKSCDTDQKSKTTTSRYLTDEQMNDLSAKILKAEIMNNTTLREELQKKLDEAVAARKNISEANKNQKNKVEDVLLTKTDKLGNAYPLKISANETDSSSYKKAARKKNVETHAHGDRVRYFPDDDKYDLKQMFEIEKSSAAADVNLQFANIVSAHKNPNDDLEDIFVDEVRKYDKKKGNKEVQEAIHEHKRQMAQIDNCDSCLDSSKMNKKLIITISENTILRLPWFIGLQRGHCIITSTQHISCCTQLDEDVWQEITNIRKNLVHMFASQRKDVIFYEIANNLHRRPHLLIHCIPINESMGEQIPFYFKKAIEESEKEWSVNKQLISLHKKGLRESIPKGLPYFWVNFGMETGFAHVIEDSTNFPQNFANEIIGGMLELDPRKWRKPKIDHEIDQKVKIFADSWKKYNR